MSDNDMRLSDEWNDLQSQLGDIGQELSECKQQTAKEIFTALRKKKRNIFLTSAVETNEFIPIEYLEELEKKYGVG